MRAINKGSAPLFQWLIVSVLLLHVAHVCESESELYWPKDKTVPEPIAFVISSHVRNSENCFLLRQGIHSFFQTWLAQSSGGMDARLRPFHIYVSDNGSPQGETIKRDGKIMYEGVGHDSTVHFDSRPCFASVLKRYPRILTVTRQNPSHFEVGSMLLAWHHPRAEYVYFPTNSTPVSHQFRKGTIPVDEIPSLRLSMRDMSERRSGQVVQLHHTSIMRNFTLPSAALPCKFCPYFFRPGFFYDTQRTPHEENVEEKEHAVTVGKILHLAKKHHSPYKIDQVRNRVKGLTQHSAFVGSFDSAVPDDVSSKNYSMATYIDALLDIEKAGAMPVNISHGMAWERLNACLFTLWGSDVRQCKIAGVQKVHGGSHDNADVGFNMTKLKNYVARNSKSNIRAGDFPI